MLFPQLAITGLPLLTTLTAAFVLASASKYKSVLERQIVEENTLSLTLCGCSHGPTPLIACSTNTSATLPFLPAL